MEQTTTILIIDQANQLDLKSRLEKRRDLKIVGSTNNVDIGFTLAERFQPKIILFNVDIPGLPEFDGYAVAEVFAQEFAMTNIILMTNSDSKRVFRHALQVGAKEVINLPVEDELLYRIINRVIQNEIKRREQFSHLKKDKPRFKTITVFNTKGGVGKSTVALNLAVAIRQETNKRVALVDLDLMSGNIALMAGIAGKNSIKDLVDDLNNLDDEGLDDYLTRHDSGIHILPAPLRPEYSSFIQTEHVEKILASLNQVFNYVVVDAPTYFHDTVIPALEKAQDILLVSTLDLPSVQNMKQCLELLTGLGLNNKARVVINKMVNKGGLRVNDLAGELGLEINSILPHCEQAALEAVNLGEPLILYAKGSQFAHQVKSLANKLVNPNNGSFFGKEEVGS